MEREGSYAKHYWMLKDLATLQRPQVRCWNYPSQDVNQSWFLFISIPLAGTEGSEIWRGEPLTSLLFQMSNSSHSFIFVWYSCVHHRKPSMVIFANSFHERDSELHMLTDVHRLEALTWDKETKPGVLGNWGNKAASYFGVATHCFSFLWCWAGCRSSPLSARIGSLHAYIGCTTKGEPKTSRIRRDNIPFSEKAFVTLIGLYPCWTLVFGMG